MLIKQLPTPRRNLVCAKLAEIPAIQNRLSAKDKAQAALILKVAAGQDRESYSDTQDRESYAAL